MSRFLREVDRVVWRYLWECFDEGEGAPSVREIAAATNYCRAHVNNALLVLEARGYVRLAFIGGRRAARGILSVRPPDEVEDTAAARAERRAAADFL